MWSSSISATCHTCTWHRIHRTRVGYLAKYWTQLGRNWHRLSWAHVGPVDTDWVFNVSAILRVVENNGPGPHVVVCIRERNILNAIFLGAQMKLGLMFWSDPTLFVSLSLFLVILHGSILWNRSLFELLLTTYYFLL